MARKRRIKRTTAEIVKVLREAETVRAAGGSLKAFAAEQGINPSMLHRWRQRVPFSMQEGKQPNEPRQPSHRPARDQDHDALEEENRRLKALLGDLVAIFLR